MSKMKKKQFLEIDRFFAILAVVMIHISMTVPNNGQIEEIGRFNYSCYSVMYAFSKWAVPLFIVISGSLLLNPEKDIDNKKIVKYVIRMLLVLVSFGFVYSLMEQVVTNGIYNIGESVKNAALNTLQDKSWDHMWYVYLMIGLYLITPFIRAAVRSIDSKALLEFIIILFVVNYIFRFFRIVTGIGISTLYVIPNEYFMFYILGYYLSASDNFFERHKRTIYLLAGGGLLFSCLLDCYSIISSGKYVLWLRNANFVNVFIVIALYIFVKYKFSRITELPGAVQSICECSFGIYLVHPFWINIIYKFLHVTPATFGNVILGMAILWCCVFALSWVTVLILKKVPCIKKIV